MLINIVLFCHVQKHINCEGAIIVPIIFYSDQMTLAINMRAIWILISHLYVTWQNSMWRLYFRQGPCFISNISYSIKKQRISSKKVVNASWMSRSHIETIEGSMFHELPFQCTHCNLFLKTTMLNTSNLKIKINVYINFTNNFIICFRGLDLIDPFGKIQLVYPMLYAWIDDHPKSCKVIFHI